MRPLPPKLLKKPLRVKTRPPLKMHRLKRMPRPRTETAPLAWMAHKARPGPEDNLRKH
jgi:hypothetical protein